MSEPISEETIFAAVLQLAPEQRGPYLDQAVGREGAVRQRVEALLSAHARSGGFLEQPIVPPSPRPSSLVPVPPAEKPGDILGRYKLLQQIGEGGCGVVYMAEQQQPVQRRVALKIIKLGMDTRQVIARFEAERQALALMDHPNIAKVLDGGATETGRPFFVMELVRGTRITDYCDENNLATRERLGLFLEVCRAVQHAHQKGIIHRDLKPSNILVTLHDGVPVPKVIDFGIAKATQGRLTDKTVFTAFEQFIGTPAYMSPEQTEMSGLDIDTRSDIYSLGVLLYELLTGKTPFDSKELLAAGLEAMRRTIREQEPARPSTRLSTMGAGELTTTARCRRTDSPRLVHTIRGDLDWIVMKCLEKDRARRYETANGLAADLQRHLNLEPVLAFPPSRLYRLRRLVRRNKFVVAAVSAVAVALVMGFGLSTWLYLQERAAKREQTRLRLQAEANEKKAQAAALKDQQIATFLKETFKGAGPSVAMGRDTAVLKEILDKTIERLGRELTNQPEVEAELRDTLSDVYQDLGDLGKAEALQRTALALWRKSRGDNDPRTALALNGLADVLMFQGKLAEAESTAREALALAKKALGSEHAQVGGALNTLATVLHDQGKLAEAEVMYREALAMQRKLEGKENPDVATDLNNLALTLRDEGKFPEAETVYREALALDRKVRGPEDPLTAVTLNNLTVVVKDQGRLSEAEPMSREVLELTRRISGEDHPDTAICLNTLAGILVDEGECAEAETLFRQVLAKQNKSLGSEAPELGTTLNNVAFALGRQHKLPEAEALYQQALVLQRKVLGQDNPDVALTLSNLADALADEGRLAEAEAAQREALATRRKMLGDENPAVAGSLRGLVDVLLRQGKREAAETILQELVTPALVNRAQGSGLLMAKAGFLARCGRWPEALVTAEQAKALNPKGNPVDHMLMLLRLANGDTEGYGQSCQQALARFSATNEPMPAARMALDCLLVFPCVVEPALAAKMADAAVTRGTNNLFLPQFQFCKALAEYRQGRFTAAADWAAKPLAGSGQPGDERVRLEAGLVLAMARWQSKQAAEARAALAEAVQLAEAGPPRPNGDLGRHWNDWLIAQTLLREARQLITAQ